MRAFEPLRFTFDGRSLANAGFSAAEHCPAWLWFLNWAADAEKLVVHTVEGVVVVRRGETLCRDPAGKMWVEPDLTCLQRQQFNGRRL